MRLFKGNLKGKTTGVPPKKSPRGVNDKVTRRDERPRQRSQQKPQQRSQRGFLESITGFLGSIVGFFLHRDWGNTGLNFLQALLAGGAWVLLTVDRNLSLKVLGGFLPTSNFFYVALALYGLVIVAIGILNVLTFLLHVRESEFIPHVGGDLLLAFETIVMFILLAITYVSNFPIDFSQPEAAINNMKTILLVITLFQFFQWARSSAPTREPVPAQEAVSAQAAKVSSPSLPAQAYNPFQSEQFASNDFTED